MRGVDKIDMLIKRCIACDVANIHTMIISILKATNVMLPYHSRLHTHHQSMILV